MPDRRPGVLVLSRIAQNGHRPLTLNSLEGAFERYLGDCHVVRINVLEAVPSELALTEWSAIILTSSFLFTRYYPRHLEALRDDFAWVAESGAVKIALPQDDYGSSFILDRWMVDWGVDVLLSVLPSHASILYPRLFSEDKIEGAYTGYVDEQWIDTLKPLKPFSDRAVDVSYRTAPPQFDTGSTGQLKLWIGPAFSASVGRPRGMAMSISARMSDYLSGASWHELLKDSRFCLGTPSGSSLHDPMGNIRRAIAWYELRHPRADFEEIAEACFQGQDGLHVMTALSPRNIEAALAETVQVAVPGDYSGLLEPGVHYIPFHQDLSNADEVADAMADSDVVDAIAANARSAILDTEELRLTRFVDRVAKLIENKSAGRGLKGITLAEVEQIKNELHANLSDDLQYGTSVRKVAVQAARRMVPDKFYNAIKVTLGR